MHKLTNAQCENVQELLDGDRTHDSIKNPLSWHQIVLHWNWDDGVEGISWWCKQKKCDLGTALAAYWLASPEFYAEFVTREAAEAARCDMASYDLVRDIEKRVADEFYKLGQIGYNPRAGFEDVDALAVPDIMKEESPGEPFELFELQRVCIRPLNEKDTKARVRKRKQADKLIGEASIESMSPTEVVAAIAKAAALLRKDPDKRGAKRSLDVLGWLWYEQAVAEYGWEILAWDWETGATMMVFSPNRDFCVMAPHLLGFGSGGTHGLTPDYVEILFANLDDLKKFERFDYEGCGILKSCEHLPYRDGS